MCVTSREIQVRIPKMVVRLTKWMKTSRESSETLRKASRAKMVQTARAGYGTPRRSVFLKMAGAASSEARP